MYKLSQLNTISKKELLLAMHLWVQRHPVGWERMERPNAEGEEQTRRRRGGVGATDMEGIARARSRTKGVAHVGRGRGEGTTHGDGGPAQREEHMTV